VGALCPRDLLCIGVTNPPNHVECHARILPSAFGRWFTPTREKTRLPGWRTTKL